MPKFMMEKLVRDQALQRCLDDPKVRTDYRILDDAEFIKALIAKVHEEVDEVPVPTNEEEAAELRAEIEEEMADLYAAVDELRNALGLSVDEIGAAQTAKAAKDGGFSRRAYIASVDLDDDSEWVEKFRRRPEKFREVA